MEKLNGEKFTQEPGKERKGIKWMKRIGLVFLGMVIGTAMTGGGEGTEQAAVPAPVEEVVAEEPVEAAEETEVAAEEVAAEEEEVVEEEPVEVVEEEPVEVVTLGAGKFLVGEEEDIRPGRYVVRTEERSGNFIVYGAFGFPEVNEILGTESGFAVNDVTIKLEEGQEIDIKSLNAVVFTPK